MQAAGASPSAKAQEPSLKNRAGTAHINTKRGVWGHTPINTIPRLLTTVPFRAEGVGAAGCACGYKPHNRSAKAPRTQLANGKSDNGYYRLAIMIEPLSQ